MSSKKTLVEPDQNKEQSKSLENDYDLEKLPPCTSLFENINQTLDVMNEQIIRENLNPKPFDSDNESIELVFDLDNQVVNEKRNRNCVLTENEKNDSENQHDEIMLDLDSNTIIHNSYWNTSSIKIKKINEHDEK